MLVDFTPAHPLPTVPPPSGGAITDPADNGNVYNNKLTVDGPNFVGQSLCGGFTAGAGNVTGNTVVVKNAAAIWGDAYIYGGFSAQGNATGNTVILGGNNYYGGYTGMRRHGLVYGGGGNNPSADHTTGNTLRVQGRLNGAYSISNFEKIEFDLTGLLLNGDWQLSLRADGPAFEWSNIKITELDAWLTALAANNINSIAIAPFASGGGVLTLTNYAPTFFNRGDYEVRKRADTTGTGTVNNIYTIFVEANRFQRYTNIVGVAARFAIQTCARLVSTKQTHRAKKAKAVGRLAFVAAQICRSLRQSVAHRFLTHSVYRFGSRCFGKRSLIESHL